MKLLVDETFVTKTNNWYAPLSEFWAKYKSIVATTFMDQTSSAGDWSGFILQKTGKNTYHAIGFSQYNNYPHDGFTLYTCEHPFFATKKANEKEAYEMARNCWLQCDND